LGEKVISFVDRGVWVQLRGNADQTEAVVEVSTTQVERWLKGDDIWAFALLEQVIEGDRQEISEDL
jgi:NOL1/NOP2/fmu family ribosome biogenesis protein